MNMKMFLGVVMTLFVLILVGVIMIARHAKPVLLDEHGRPYASQGR